MFAGLLLVSSPFVALIVTMIAGVRVRDSKLSPKSGKALILIPASVFLWSLVSLKVILPNLSFRMVFDLPTGFWMFTAPVLVSIVAVQSILLRLLFLQISPMWCAISLVMCALAGYSIWVSYGLGLAA